PAERAHERQNPRSPTDEGALHARRRRPRDGRRNCRPPPPRRHSAKRPAIQRLPGNRPGSHRHPFGGTVDRRDTMIHLASVRLDQDDVAEEQGFPFDVPIVRSLETLDFTSEVTLLVGENGSGKSTLLEAIAIATRLPAVGSDRLDADSTLEAVRPLANYLRLSWNRRTHRGFFMRTE